MQEFTMKDSKENTKEKQKPKLFNCFSESESHVSTSKIKKQQKSQSKNILKKLRQLWNKQKYLTDDQQQCQKEVKEVFVREDSSMDYQPQDSVKQFSKDRAVNFLRKAQGKFHQTKVHQRVVSSSDQHESFPQKMKKSDDSKQELKAKEVIRLKVKMLQLASVSSAFQDQSQKLQTP